MPWSAPTRRTAGPRQLIDRPHHALFVLLPCFAFFACTRAVKSRAPTTDQAVNRPADHADAGPATHPADPELVPRDMGASAVEGAPTDPVDPGAARPSPLLPGFVERVIFSGLVRPTAVRFAKDGRVFVAEKSGIIKMFSSLAAAAPIVVADLGIEVHDYADRGLLDLELDPSFPAEPHIYAFYTLDGRVGDSLAAGTVPRYRDACPDPKIAGCVVAGRLVKLTLSGDLAATNRSQVILVENWPQQFPSHSVAGLAFGPDGLLYAAAGDGASFEHVDYGNLGGNPLREPPDPAPNAQRPPRAMGGALRAQVVEPPHGPVSFQTSFSGKVIRLGARNPPGSGAVATSPVVIASGLRNPFRMAFRPDTPELFIGDVGWGTWEEINRIADVTKPGVVNFGWPCFEGREPQPGYQAAGLDLCNAVYATPAAHAAPLLQYRHAAEVVAGDGCGMGSSAVSGVALYAGGAYPKEYEGALFFSDFARKCIWVMPQSASAAPDPARIRAFMVGAAQPVQLQLGLERDLYYVDFAGSLRRIIFLGGNHQPRAELTATPRLGPLPLTVTFDASKSADPDGGDRLSLRWDLDGDGEFDDAEGSRVSHTYRERRQITVQVLVTDASGARASAATRLWPGHVAPTAVIDAVSPGNWKVNDIVTFSGHALDGTGTALPASALHWSIVTHHCPDGCHEHALQQFAGVDSGAFRAPDHEYPVHLSVVLTATDAEGLTATATRLLEPRTADLVVGSEPPGLELALNGLTAAAPFSRTVIVGSLNSLSAPSQVIASTAHRFARWSDRRGQSHSVTARAGENRYTAVFESLPLAQISSQATRIVTHADADAGPDAERIRDGKRPALTSTDEAAQYSTRGMVSAGGKTSVGYEFDRSHTYARIVFQEGLNTADGGHFETLGVEVRRNGTWIGVAGLRTRPTYAGANGIPWETFTLDFEPTTGEAIRLVGAPGGTAGFIAVAELEIWAGVP